ncbi:hypothetical protein [Dyadobacter sp. CY345]|nr:hypothetical protein [Dyadobacter sp. CY345]
MFKKLLLLILLLSFKESLAQYGLKLPSRPLKINIGRGKLGM